MRTAFINELIVQARIHPEIFLIVGDLGFSVVEPFAEEFPERFLNAGIAEQNMTGVAAGLASEGFHVFTYSIANFPTLRCLEQFRNDVCYHNFPVTVVAVGAGLAYGNLGYSHHAVQDIGCMRGMPNISIFSPADPDETLTCVKTIVENPGPSYLRIGKAGEPPLYPRKPFNGNLVLAAGSPSASNAIVTTGSILGEAIQASKKHGDCAVYSLPVIAPLFPESLTPLWKHRVLVTLEEHVRAGGIGEMLSPYRPDDVTIHSLNVAGHLSDVVGSQKTLRKVHGIDSEAILAVFEVL